MSDDKPQRPIQVGDEIGFRRGRRWNVFKVEKITDSGRINVGHYVLNPDLSVRGVNGWSGPYQGVLLTDELRKEISEDQEYEAILYKIGGIGWREIQVGKLKRIYAILQ